MPSFDLDRIRRETFISQIDFHEEIGSTNTRALALANETRTFPTLVLAERQTAGRGRGNNRWWAGDGGLTLSVLLNASDFAIPASRWPLISLTAGLAVGEAIACFVPAGDVRLKWPNDVFLNGRKACGILIETASNRSGMIVIGIGLNVNNSFAKAPPEVLSIATSLADVTGCTLDPSNVLIAVLQQLAKCLTLVGSDVSQLADLWRARCYLDGRTVQVSTGLSGSGSEDITGVCQGIDDDGALLLQTETGVVRCFSGVVARIL